MVRVAVKGGVTRDGWAGPGDPLKDLCGEDIYSRIVLMDVADSMHIDSTGVEWLLSCHHRFQTKGGMLIVHSVSPLAKRLLKMMRVDSVVSIVDDEASGRALAEEVDDVARNMARGLDEVDD
jgi:anti-anti-sigma regulatory factor